MIRDCCSALLSLCLLFGAAEVRAQIGEGDLKAAFVYNFAKFVEWPAELQGGPLWLCTVGGGDSLILALPKLVGKQVQGRELALRPSTGRGDALRGCHVVILAESEGHRATEVARAAVAAGALSVSTLPDFVDQGGMVGLLTQDNRIQFEVNPDAAQAGRLKLAAQFVKLARNIKK